MSITFAPLLQEVLLWRHVGWCADILFARFIRPEESGKAKVRKLQEARRKHEVSRLDITVT